MAWYVDRYIHYTVNVFKTMAINTSKKNFCIGIRAFTNHLENAEVSNKSVLCMCALPWIWPPLPVLMVQLDL